MKRLKKSDWLVPTGLIALSLVPMLASILLLAEISQGVQTTKNARFLTMPWPIVLHILASLMYCILGALQFSTGLRLRKPRLHRAMGWLLIPCGLVSALSGLWMTQFYPSANYSPVMYDGFALYAARMLAGSAMALFLLLGWVAILRRDILSHQDWMMRTYALGIAAGTQVFTHIPWFVFPSIQGELARTLCMVAGWVVNLTVVETLIWKKRPQRKASMSHDKKNLLNA